MWHGESVIIKHLYLRQLFSLKILSHRNSYRLGTNWFSPIDYSKSSMLKVVLALKFSFVPYNMISTIMWLKHDPENLFENVKLSHCLRMVKTIPYRLPA